jgi:glycosyltransferase involved in cell wall biosynthesis
MAADPITVAIPVLNGGPLLEETLAAVRSQELERPVELLVADSGSTDGSRDAAAHHGAELIDVPPGEFGHGRTRNLLMERASGRQVAFLTQDATPAGSHWLRALAGAFELADDVALAYGPYRARPGASPAVERDLADWFGSLAPDGRPRVDRWDGPGAPPGPGPLTFFSDANGCVARAAWESVPFRDVPYAEDQLLAREMLTAGHAKVFQPDAAVIHSHDYRPLELLRRSFDEGRGLQAVFGWRAPATPLRAGLTLQRRVRDDVRFAGPRAAPGSLRHHSLRLAGEALGTRADRLPAGLRRRLSLEARP